MTKLTDIAIVRQVQAGNRQAYQELMTRYKSYVYTLVMRLVKHSEEAEEVAQDVFVQAFRSLGRFEGKSKFSTWLYRIAYNTAVSHLRKVKQKRQHQAMASKYDVADTRSITPQERLTQQERTVFLKKGIDQLSTTDASIITLFYLNELSLKEISKVMNVEMNTVKVKLFRARQRLAKHMQQLLAGEAQELY